MEIYSSINYIDNDIINYNEILLDIKGDSYMRYLIDNFMNEYTLIKQNNPYAGIVKIGNFISLDIAKEVMTYLSKKGIHFTFNSIERIGTDNPNYSLNVLIGFKMLTEYYNFLDNQKILINKCYNVFNMKKHFNCFMDLDDLNHLNRNMEKCLSVSNRIIDYQILLMKSINDDNINNNNNNK